MCHYFLEFGKHGGHFLPRSHRALQGWKRRTPPRSRDPHVWCIWAVLILEFLRHGHRSMGVYLLWMVTCYFRPGEPLTILRGDIQIPIQGISSRHQVLLYPEGPTTEVQNICSQRHGRVVLSLVRELALDSSSPRPWKPHGTCIQLQLSRFLGSVEQNDRGDEVGEFHPTLDMARHSGKSTDAALGTR